MKTGRELPQATAAKDGADCHRLSAPDLAEGNSRHDLVVGEVPKGLKSLAITIRTPVVALSLLSRSVEQRASYLFVTLLFQVS
nr:DnaB helicase C-terminal domain-containing protein [Erwinia rhapontici]